jgi:hypothetical protein
VKNIIFFFILVLCSQESLQPQIYISTNLRQEGKFNVTTKLYDSASRDNTELSYFEFDKNFTRFSHHTFTKTSLYRIKSAKKSEPGYRWEFDIVSNTGYSYYMIIDILNSNIRFIYKEKGTAYLTQFVVDKFWIVD